jgi:hypothetical protein
MRPSVDKSAAWLYQAMADRQAAERFLADERGTGRCHAIAKWQQTVEKAVKALVSALYDAGIVDRDVLPRHDVERYVGLLVRVPRDASNRTIPLNLQRLLDQNTRVGIRALDALAPRMPPGRNTEYPFQDAQGQWTFPAAEDVFSQDEVQQFRALAHRVLDGAGRIVSAIRRRPS